MSIKYEDEQKELTEKIKALRTALDKSVSKSVTVDMFIGHRLQIHTGKETHATRVLNELVEGIEVHQAEKVNGVWEQRLTIRYNCIGTIDIPMLSRCLTRRSRLIPAEA